MRFFHLSDLHIGLKLMNRDLREDQEYILRQITVLAARERPDAIVIAGDIYDKAVPSAEAVEVFDHFIGDLRAAVPEAVIMMISGNHDSASRVNCFRSVLSRQKLYMVGQPPRTETESIEKVICTDEFGRVNFYLLPFVKPSMVKDVIGKKEDETSYSYSESVCRLIERENLDPGDRNVLVSHQFYVPRGVLAENVERMDSEVLTVGNIDEVPAEILEHFDYAALGHIHKPMKVGSERFRYSGTPLACSVSEAGQEKGILMVELGAKGAEYEEASGKQQSGESDNRGRQTEKAACPAGSEIHISVLPLTPLRQIRVIKGTLEEVLRQSCEDYVTVILTDKTDLEVTDMQERLRLAFPFLLEIRRENVRMADYNAEDGLEEDMDPLELCCSFLKDADSDEKELLQDVIRTVQEAQACD